MIKFRLLAILIGLILLACLFGAVGQMQMQTYPAYSADYPSDYPSDYSYNNNWNYPYYSQDFYPYYYPLYSSYHYPYYYPYYQYYYPYYDPYLRYHIYPFDSYPLGTFGLIAGGNYPIKLINSLEASSHR